MAAREVLVPKGSWSGRRLVVEVFWVWTALWGMGGIVSARALEEKTGRKEAGFLEVRLHAQAELADPVVRLGDLAEVFPSASPSATRLADLELFPAPAPGQRRYVSVMELEELLMRRGVSVGALQFSGSNQVEIRRRTDQPETPSVRRNPTLQRRGERLVREAILHYLQQKVSAGAGWNVEVSLDSSLAEGLTDPVQIAEVRGGSPPWTGRQSFEITLSTPQGLRNFVVQAEVTLPPSVVVAARAIAKGTILQPGDLTLQRLPTGEEPTGYFQKIEDLIGQEALQTIPAGKPVVQEAVHAPIVVRRGQVVTVYARAPGIRVRTLARARDDGSQGDLIGVESLTERKTFFARVCGIQEVEVFARGVHTASFPSVSQEAALLRSSP